jgi:branched-subunit amino acid permease
MNFLSGMWNSVTWFFNPMQDTNQIKKDGAQIGNNVQNTVNTASDMLPTIATDLEWLIVALVGLLAYAFIFKR